jgi:hypothetical protein
MEGNRPLGGGRQQGGIGGRLSVAAPMRLPWPGPGWPIDVIDWAVACPVKVVRRPRRPRSYEACDRGRGQVRSANSGPPRFRASHHRQRLWSGTTTALSWTVGSTTTCRVHPGLGRVRRLGAVLTGEGWDPLAGHMASIRSGRQGGITDRGADRAGLWGLLGRVNSRYLA